MLSDDFMLSEDFIVSDDFMSDDFVVSDDFGALESDLLGALLSLLALSF